MFKVKYFFITFSVIYMAFTVICLLCELNNISTTNRQIMRTVSLASDMAIQQAVASDEMFNSITGQSSDNRNDISEITSISVAKSGDIHYSTENVFALTYNQNNTIETDDDKEWLFRTMFFNSENSLFVHDKDFLRDLLKITTVINGDYVPVLVQIGLLDSETGIGETDLSADGTIPPMWYSNFNEYYNKYALVDKVMSKEDADYLGAYHIKKVYKYRDFSASTPIYKEETYFLAPTNVGVTYVDSKILQNAFIANMDLLMRADVDKEPSDVAEVENNNKRGLQLKEGIMTIAGFEGEALIANADLSRAISDYNVIHDKNMVYIKGKFDERNGGYACDANKYSRPQIDYMVIDLCTDSAKERELLCTALGLPNSARESLEAYIKWLKSLGLDPEGTETPTKNDDHRYISVARITTYADVAISISTPIGRQLNAMYSRYNIKKDSDKVNYNAFTNDTGLKNTLNLHCFPYTMSDKADYNTSCENAGVKPNYSELTGNPLYVYTSYFAIM